MTYFVDVGQKLCKSKISLMTLSTAWGDMMATTMRGPISVPWTGFKCQRLMVKGLFGWNGSVPFPHTK